MSSEATVNKNVALDIGGGTGQLGLPLAKVYGKVYGIDASHSQLESARIKISNQKEHNNIQYSYANSHDLEEFWTRKMKKQKGDLVTFGQSLHWLDYDLLFKSYQKYMAEGGAMAIFSYGTCKIVDPNVLEQVNHNVEAGIATGTKNQLDTEFEKIESHGVKMDKEYTDKEVEANELFQKYYASIKPHIKFNLDDLDNHYSHINFSDYFSDVKRYLYYDVKKDMKISDYIQFVRTMSGYRGYLQKFPDKNDPLEALIQSFGEIYQVANESELENKTFDILFPYFLATLKY